MYAHGNRAYSRLKILAMFYIIPTGVKSLNVCVYNILKAVP